MKRFVILLVCMVVLAVQLGATGTILVTREVVRADSRSWEKCTIAWTSHTDGTVSGTLTEVTPGKLVNVEFIPNAAGYQPTALYDVSLHLPSGVDVLTVDGVSSGSNLSNTAASVLVYSSSVVTSTTLELRVVNAGSGKKGTIVLWIER